MAFRPGTSVEAASAASRAPEWVPTPAAPPGSAAVEGEGWGGAHEGRGSRGSSAESPRESMSGSAGGSERSRSAESDALSLAAESDALSLSLETGECSRESARGSLDQERPSLKAPGAPAPGARTNLLRAGRDPSELIGGAEGAAIEDSRQLARPTSRKALHSDGALAATVQRDAPGGLPGDLSLTRISISGDSSGSSSASPPRAARDKSLRAPPEPSWAPPHQGKASTVRAPSPGSVPRRAQREAASAEESTGVGGLGLSGRIMYQPPGSGALGGGTLGGAEGVPRPATRARSALLSGAGARGGAGGSGSGSGPWRAVNGVLSLGGQDTAGGADADAGEGAGGRRVIQSASLMRRKAHARPATARGARVASPTMRAPGGSSRLGQSRRRSSPLQQHRPRPRRAAPVPEPPSQPSLPLGAPGSRAAPRARRVRPRTLGRAAAGLARFARGGGKCVAGRGGGGGGGCP
jgi:hypothetical protein